MFETKIGQLEREVKTNEADKYGFQDEVTR